MAEVKHVNDSTFESEVVNCAQLVLVDFWAPWCGPCRMIAPVVEKLAERYEGRLKVCKLNTDEAPDTPGRFNVHGIPTLIVFEDGKEVERVVGFAPEPALAAKVELLLSGSGHDPGSADRSGSCPSPSR
ncbi:thioredoxin [candidate division WOR-3 bacterium]|nr:thioredoxin [candidate division WOR-3 bacterium]